METKLKTIESSRCNTASPPVVSFKSHNQAEIETYRIVCFVTRQDSGQFTVIGKQKVGFVVEADAALDDEHQEDTFLASHVTCSEQPGIVKIILEFLMCIIFECFAGIVCTPFTLSNNMYKLV